MLIPVSVQKLIVYGLGLIAIWVIGIMVTAIIWHLVSKWFRNGKGNRRNGEALHWTVELLIHTKETKNLMKDMNEFMRNGFNNSIQDLTKAVNECHDKHTQLEKSRFLAEKQGDKDKFAL